MTLNKRRFAALSAMSACALAVGVLAAVPAGAAQAPHPAVTAAPAVSAAPAGNGKPLPADIALLSRDGLSTINGEPAGTRVLATASAAWKGIPGKATPAVTGDFTCSVDASGLYLIQPGGTWGPYYSDYFVDALGDYAWVSCSGDAPLMTVTGNILWNGVNYPASGVTYYNTAISGEAYDITECAEGGWQSGGIASITLPPGYVKSSFYLVYQSGSISLDGSTCEPDND